MTGARNTVNNIEGKVIIITGASSGIGEACARQLSARGAKLVLAARRVELLEELATELGGSAACKAVDVRRFAELDSLASFAIEQFGQIDVLINNAGIMPLAPIGAATIDDIDRVIDVNLKGLIFAIKAVLPNMTERGLGQIVNISSTGGFSSSKLTAVYSATKFGVRAISEGLRKDVGDTIRITTVYPGPVKTALAQSIPDEAARKYIDDLYSSIGLDASAIADAVEFVVDQPDNVSIDDITVNARRAG